MKLLPFYLVLSWKILGCIGGLDLRSLSCVGRMHSGLFWVLRTFSLTSGFNLGQM